MDTNGNLCIIAGKKQAGLLLRSHYVPGHDPVIGTFQSLQKLTVHTRGFSLQGAGSDEKGFVRICFPYMRSCHINSCYIVQGGINDARSLLTKKTQSFRPGDSETSGGWFCDRSQDVSTGGSPGNRGRCEQGICDTMYISLHHCTGHCLSFSDWPKITKLMLWEGHCVGIELLPVQCPLLIYGSVER